nr:hypothetical protein [Candidatus Frankia alpina]
MLIDIDGVLTVSWQTLPGAPQALDRLRAAGLGLVFVTNTTSRDRASIAAALVDAGFTVDPAEVFTAPVMAATYLRQHHPGARCHILNSGDISADLAGVMLPAPGERPDVIVLGGAGPEFSYEALNQVFAWATGRRADRRAAPQPVLAYRRRAPARHRCLPARSGAGARPAGGRRRQAGGGILRHGATRARFAARGGRDDR